MDLKYYRLKIPMKSPFTTSFGTTLDKDVIIFELNHDGIKAFSELITVSVRTERYIRKVVPY